MELLDKVLFFFIRDLTEFVVVIITVLTILMIIIVFTFYTMFDDRKMYMIQWPISSTNTYHGVECDTRPISY